MNKISFEFGEMLFINPLGRSYLTTTEHESHFVTRLQSRLGYELALSHYVQTRTQRGERITPGRIARLASNRPCITGFSKLKHDSFCDSYLMIAIHHDAITRGQKPKRPRLSGTGGNFSGSNCLQNLLKQRQGIRIWRFHRRRDDAS